MDQSSNTAGGAWDAAGVDKFTLRDLFRSTRLAIGPTKWLTALFPVVLALVVPALAKSGLRQLNVSANSSWFTLLDVFGWILFYYGCAFAVSGVAYLVRGELLDTADRSFDDVWAFWRRHKWTLFWPPLMLLILVAMLLALPILFALFGGILTWIGRIPNHDIDFLVGLGGVLWSLSLVGGIPLGILSSVFLLVLVLGSFVYPVIVAIKEDEHFDVAHDMIQVVFEQGPKLVLAIFMTFGFMLVSAVVVWAGANTALCVGHWVLGDDMLNMVASAPGITQSFTSWITDANSILGVAWLPKWPGPAVAIAPAAWSGGFLGVVLVLVSVGFGAYLVSLYSASATLSYLALADPLEIEDVMQRLREAAPSDPFATPPLDSAAGSDAVPGAVPSAGAPEAASAEASGAPPAAPLAPPAAEKESAPSPAKKKARTSGQTGKKSSAAAKSTRKAGKKKAGKKKKKKT